jgi:hypothetical protein
MKGAVMTKESKRGSELHKIGKAGRANLNTKIGTKVKGKSASRLASLDSYKHYSPKKPS